VTCPACQNILERPNVPHVIRTCVCGRQLRIAEPGEKGKGLRVEKGDQVVIPAGFITFSLNPLKTRGRLFRAGIDLLAANLFLDGIASRASDPWAHLLEVERRTDEIVNRFAPIAGLEVNRQEDAEAILKIMLEHKGTKEFYAFWTGQMLASWIRQFGAWRALSASLRCSSSKTNSRTWFGWAPQCPDFAMSCRSGTRLRANPWKTSGKTHLASTPLCCHRSSQNP
jgi:hypothetical protein